MSQELKDRKEAALPDRENTNSRGYKVGRNLVYLQNTKLVSMFRAQRASSVTGQIRNEQRVQKQGTDMNWLTFVRTSL